MWRVSPAQKFLYADNHNGSSGFCNGYLGRQAIVARIADGATVLAGIALQRSLRSR